jgi:16S rRNA (guanine527-N7)-methyltransferase
VSLRDIAEALDDRARRAGLIIPEELGRQLVAYYQLLAHWNRTINLTALSDLTEAIDRLLLEPIAAAAYVPHGTELIDLGSGGGSPAIPLALGIEASRLVMVESRTRKAAFLREVLRELGLKGTVEAARFEDLAARPEFAGQFGVLSVRAVRLGAPLFASIGALLRPSGCAALFVASQTQEPPVGLPESLTWSSTHELPLPSRCALTLLARR